MRTFIPKREDLLGRKFQIVDATDMILGKMCSKIASVLRGKDKTIVTPGVDCGDKVIVINSDKLILTSNKLDTAIHYKHTGYLGNLKEKTMRYRMEKDSTEVVRTTVKRMLGKGPLARERLRNLFIYKDEHHKHKGAPIRAPKECSMFRLGKELSHRGRDENFRSGLDKIRIISEVPRSLSDKSTFDKLNKRKIADKELEGKINDGNLTGKLSPNSVNRNKKGTESFGKDNQSSPSVKAEKKLEDLNIKKDLQVEENAEAKTHVDEMSKEEGHNE